MRYSVRCLRQIFPEATLRCRSTRLCTVALLLFTAASLQAQHTLPEQRAAQHSEWPEHVAGLRTSMAGSSAFRVDQRKKYHTANGLKCGTPRVLLEHRDALQAVPTGGAPQWKAPRPAAKQVSRLSPSGRFIIHYDTSGYHTPAMLTEQGQRIAGSAHEYIDALAAAFDTSWTVQVDILGYDAPPAEGSGRPYEIFVEESGGSEYGFTMPIEETGGGTAAPTYTTYIQLDNDFREFPTRGLPAAQATAAHEFHHAIQLGRYGSWMDHLYIHEMTSTCMEEVVFPLADDYIEYLEDYMRDPQRSLYTWPGYEAVLWPLRLHILRGPDPWRTVWEGCREHQPMEAMKEAFAAMGSSLLEEYCAFVQELYYSGYRAGASSVFPDAARYPLPRITKDHQLLDSAQQSGTVPILGVRFYRFVDGSDTLSMSVAAADETLAVERSSLRISFSLVVKRYSSDPTMTQLSGGWQYRLETSMPSALCVSAYVDSPTAVEEMPTPRTVALPPFPQPFLPRLHTAVRIPLPAGAKGQVAVTVHTIHGRLLRQLSASVPYGDHGQAAVWDGRDAEGRNLPSGVYVYTIHAPAGGILHGKLTLIQTAH